MIRIHARIPKKRLIPKLNRKFGCPPDTPSPIKQKIQPIPYTRESTMSALPLYFCEGAEGGCGG